MKEKIRRTVMAVSALLAVGFMGGVETTPVGESVVLPAVCASVCVIILAAAYMGGKE